VRQIGNQNELPDIASFPVFDTRDAGGYNKSSSSIDVNIQATKFQVCNESKNILFVRRFLLTTFPRVLVQWVFMMSIQNTQILRFYNRTDEIGLVTKGSSEEIKETSASSKVLSANDVMNTKLFFHQPPLNNRNEDNISFQSRNSEPVHGTFFTKSQTHQLLKFPNDIVNPNNRLQISEEELATVTPDISLSSEEVGEFFTKGISSKNDSSIGSLLRDEIHTMNLTLSIVRQSTWGDENIVFSPLSIANVLALLRLGSSGRTLKVFI
jgi:hypothetical protein